MSAQPKQHPDQEPEGSRVTTYLGGLPVGSDLAVFREIHDRMAREIRADEKSIAKRKQTLAKLARKLGVATPAKPANDAEPLSRVVYDPDDWIKLADLAKRQNRSKDATRMWAKRSGLAFSYLGRTYVSQRALEAFMAS